MKVETKRNEVITNLNGNLKRICEVALNECALGPKVKQNRSTLGSNLLTPRTIPAVKKSTVTFRTRRSLFTTRPKCCSPLAATLPTTTVLPSKRSENNVNRLPLPAELNRLLTRTFPITLYSPHPVAAEWVEYEYC